ncbi:hypothetical protein Lpp219_07501 [Lacticaseibacillus paracasei subsp. paracasei Lpp219]|nr:hypothetical protein Lpp219_07501 [Lacticaseibacillus paracasei subsp. paracasei Lpp219]
MSNETKRDVFVDAVDALADAQASGGNVGHQDANLFMAEYDTALPDDLPVIPEAVGRMITKMKPTCNSILGSQYRDYGKDHRWIINHYDTFARAWLLGVWRVEETGEVVKL